MGELTKHVENEKEIPENGSIYGAAKLSLTFSALIPRKSSNLEIMYLK
ncbi:MAG: hypothetical protein AAGA43_04880 [Bacteroidota bacterium]